MLSGRILMIVAGAAACAGSAVARDVGPVAPAVIDAVSQPAALGPARRPARDRLAALHVLPPVRPSFELADQPPAETSPQAGRAEAAADAGPVVPVLPPARPDFPGEAAAPTPAAPSPAAADETPAPVSSLFSALFGPQTISPLGSRRPAPAGRARIDALIAEHAKLNDVPESLVHRIVVRESRYDPRAIGRGGAMGLMQIKTGTARALGYQGDAAGLLDAETNVTYAVRYLAGAYRVAGGDHDRAVRHYANGYYYAAKRMGLAGDGAGRRTRTARRGRSAPAGASAVAAAEPTSATR